MSESIYVSTILATTSLQQFNLLSMLQYALISLLQFFIFHQNIAARKLSMTESNELGQEESRHVTAKENLVFQEAYMETTGAKSTKSRGHGYRSNPNKTQMLQRRVLEQERELLRLKEQLAKQAADKEAEKEQFISSIKESLMQEVKAMVAQNQKQGQLAPVSKLRHSTILNV